MSKIKSGGGLDFNVMVQVTPWMELGSEDGLQPFIDLAKGAVAHGIYTRTKEIINLDRVECDITPGSLNQNTIILCRHPIHITKKTEETEETEEL